MTSTRPPSSRPDGARAAGPRAAGADIAWAGAWRAALRRDVIAFAAAATGTPLDDAVTWRRLASRWEWFTALLRPRQQEQVGRGGDHPHPGGVALSPAPASQSELERLLGASTAGWARLAGTPDQDARAALVVRTTAVRERLVHQLEGEALPLARAEDGPRGWMQAVHTCAPLAPRGLSLGQPRLLSWLLFELPALPRDRVLAQVTPAERLGWRLTRPGFEAGERRTFRYAG